MSWQVGLYAIAVLIPLAAFAVEAIFIRQLKRNNAYVATGAIGLSCVLALIGFLDYAIESGGFAHNAEAAAAEETHGAVEPQPDSGESEGHHKPLVWSGKFDWLILGGRGCDRRSDRQRASQARLGRFPGNSDRQSDRRDVSHGHVHRDLDSHLFDGLHARRPALSAVFHLPVALLLFDARPGCLEQRLHDLHLLGAGRASVRTC